MAWKKRPERVPDGGTAGFSGQQTSGRLAKAASARARASGILTAETPGRHSERWPRKASVELSNSSTSRKSRITGPVPGPPAEVVEDGDDLGRPQRLRQPQGLGRTRGRRDLAHFTTGRTMTVWFSPGAVAGKSAVSPSALTSM